MMPAVTEMPSAELFRSPALIRRPQGVDFENNIIFGAALMQVGRINDNRTIADADGIERELTVDLTTLEQAQSLAQTRSRRGLKARFTHPNMSTDGLGNHLGRWQDLRIVDNDGDITFRGDLHVADVAFKSPKGDLGTYVLEFADEDAEAFGNSLASRFDVDAMQSAGPTETGHLPIRFSQIIAADVVDSPAATRGGFFEVDFSVGTPVDIPVVVTDILETQFAGATREVIESRFRQFLDRYFGQSGETSMSDTTNRGPVEELDTAAPQHVENETPETEVETISETAAPPVTDYSVAAKEIAALCNQHNCSHMIADFLGKDFSVEQVRHVLLANYASQNVNVAPTELDSTTNDASSKFGREYDANAAIHRKTGTTRDRYIESRKVTSGHQPLIELQVNGS